MSPDVFGPEDGTPEEDPDNDITPWLVEYARSNLAEHHSILFDSTPKPVIELIVRMTLAGLVVNSESDPDGTFPDPRGDDNAEGT